jgi:DNA ligase (NAD+)
VATAPEVSDAEYDALVRELRDLEARDPRLITPGSPTQRVAGLPARAFAHVAHHAARVARALPSARPAWVCEPKAVPGPLAGTTFVLTGALEGLARDAARDLVGSA